MRHQLVLASLLLTALIPAAAHAHVSIGINLELYPHLVRVPGYPVYYAPEMDSNYFFYEGQYWVYTEDGWYASSWYNGPWDMVDSEIVPLYVLRIPVRYYRQPPLYFRGWSAYSPPHWDEHWGNDWSQHHRDWDHWDHRETPTAAPLPVYQKRYSGSQYPRVDQQQQLQNRYYQHQPHRATAQPVDQSQRMQNEQQRTEQHIDRPIDRNIDRHIDQRGGQHNERRPDTQQPATQTPRESLPAPQSPVSIPRPAPVVNAPIRPRPQPSEQRNPGNQQRSPRHDQTQSHDPQQGRRESDRN